MVGLSRKRVFPKTKGDSITGQDGAQKHCDFRFSQIEKKSKVAVLQLIMNMTNWGILFGKRLHYFVAMLFKWEQKDNIFEISSKADDELPNSTQYCSIVCIPFSKVYSLLKKCRPRSADQDPQFFTHTMNSYLI